MKLMYLFLISLFICSCKDSKPENEHAGAVEDSVQVRGIMRNGLVKELSGQWVNTALFDSTLSSKELVPWMDDFYGDLYLEISDADTVIIKGNMDGGNIFIKRIDENSFTLLETAGRPVFTYSAQTGLITEKFSGGKTTVFRKVKTGDKLDIIENEELFNTFFIGQFFTDDFFKQKTKPEISDIWNGFLTYKPFVFDAIAVKNKNGDLDWYAWEFKGDTLKLYNTTYNENEDSGFFIYQKGSLKERYVRSK